MLLCQTLCGRVAGMRVFPGTMARRWHAAAATRSAEAPVGRLAFPDPPLDADGLLLRGLTVDDAAAVALAADDDEVLHFAYGDRRPLNDADFAREFLGGYIADLRERDSAVMLGIFERGAEDDRGRLLGATLLWGLDLDRGFGELGYW